MHRLHTNDIKINVSIIILLRFHSCYTDKKQDKTLSVASGESTAVKSIVWKSYHSEVIFSKLSPVESNFRNITCSYYSYFKAIVFSPAMGNVDFYRLTTVNISIT